MSIKTKTTTVAALAALAVPSAALAHDGDKGKHRGHDKDRSGQAESRNDDRGHDKGHKGKHKGRRAFFLAGTDVSGLTVTDGKLAGPITLDPIFASRNAFKALELTREKVKSEDTIQVGAAGDAVEVKYKGLQPTDAIAPTDFIKIHAKLDRKTGAIDIKHIKVWRKTAKPEAPAS